MIMAARHITTLILHSCLLAAVYAGKTYIVHMKHSHTPETYTTAADWYCNHLYSVTSATKDALLYTYAAAFQGYAAFLMPEQAASLRQSDAVIGVYDDPVYQVQTTRTPEFLGLEPDGNGMWEGYELNKLNRYSENVIIGVLDTGIWPESESFSGHSLSSIPKRWRGRCTLADDFDPDLHCGRKIIGAQFYSQGYEASKHMWVPQTPRDFEGHGTHTASTAAGSTVKEAGFFGYANGTARGMANHARLSTYKVCWDDGCYGSDILAGMDAAIYDGVDIISMSLGSDDYYDYSHDPIAIGAYAAMAKGILVSCSAGNGGPDEASISNVAPWIITVGAGTLNRNFPSYAYLGNGMKYEGASLYSDTGLGNESYPLVYVEGSDYYDGNFCVNGTLDKEVVAGKVVVFERGGNGRVEKGAMVKEAGGVGMILANTYQSGEELVADPHLIPALEVGSKEGREIIAYASRAEEPIVAISFAGTVVKVKPAPVVAAFSSRGPNMVTPEILKPDVIGPGVNILAAWPQAVAPSGLSIDERRTNFNIISGTSMSCPHISGVAALLKAAHPNWTPSAIRSALMTTAYTLDNTNSTLSDFNPTSSTSTPFAYGSGHIDPRKAISPGLVYDLTPDDYLQFLCSLDYGLATVQAITRQPNASCKKKLSRPGQLNYPSFSVILRGTEDVSYSRVLTNVGPARSVYSLSMVVPSFVNMTVSPMELYFQKKRQKIQYNVTFSVKNQTDGLPRFAFGSISWTYNKYIVTSPIAFNSYR